MLKPNIKARDLQFVKDDIQKAIAEFSTNDAVLVGLPEQAGQHEDDNITNAELGALLHFGNEHIPARPWLDIGVARGNAKYAEVIERRVKAGENLEDCLEEIGVLAQGEVQLYMRELRSPPNAPSTVRQKGSDNPLIDNGELRQSVTHLVTNRLPEEGL